MLYEYRSDDVQCLAKMENMFNKMIDAYAATGVELAVERIGDRPCGVILDNPEYDEFINKIKQSIKDIIGQDPYCGSGSTDANVPLSMGVPAFCLTGAQGGGCHTREEWLDVASLKTGVSLILDFMARFCFK